MESFTISEALKKLHHHEDLSTYEVTTLFDRLSQKRDDAQWEAILRALSIKGETVGEIAGAVAWLRGKMVGIVLPKEYDSLVVDCCGTGGDGQHTFNVSTLAALVAACDGTKLLKHCGRSASGGLGSGDILDALGIPMAHTPSSAIAMLEKTNIAFLSAPSFHPALYKLARIRKQLGHPSIINLAAPLSHPATLTRQMVGVGKKALIPKIAHLLQQLGMQKGIVVHGNELDEFSIFGESEYVLITEKNVTHHSFDPHTIDLSSASLSDITCSSVMEAVEKAMKVVNGIPGAESDIVALNAGAILYLDDAVMSISDGFYRAHEIILSGALKNLIDRMKS